MQCKSPAEATWMKACVFSLRGTNWAEGIHLDAGLKKMARQVFWKQ
jgi:hypothetical protein